MTSAEPRTGNRPAKITAHHLERWAFVYVRQSHPQQVQRHRESAPVQANLRQRALDWGWPPERIRVLQGDQGCSGTSHSLAGASGSTRQTATLVTPSPHAIVSAQVLLELARWCQQQLATREEIHRCYPVESTPKSPPAPAEHAAGPGHSALARVDAPTPSQPAGPVDHPAAPTRRPHRSPRNGGGR